LRPPRKGRTFDDPGRLPSYRDVLTCFRRKDPNLRASSLRIQRVCSHTVSPSSKTADRVSTCGLFRFRHGDFTWARSCLSVRLATPQGARSRCVRSISATQHSTNEYPYSSAPGSSSGLAPCVYQRGCASPDRGIERFTTLKSLQRIAWYRGEFSSRFTLPIP